MPEKQPPPHRINRIARRARIIYLVIPVLVAVIILGIGQAISRNIADDNAMRMSRQYAVESAANFQVFMNPHMRLMQQMSYSTAIARWLANEDDSVAKEAAFEAMMGHAVTMPDAYFMFTVYETWRGYNFYTTITVDEFEAWGQLSGGEASQWFFDTLEAELPFILNVQRTRPDEHGSWVLYIWSNHRIYYEGRVVGVFTLGSPFAAVYNAAFYGFDVYGKRGYIIDQYGMVRMDSAGILETTVAGIPVFPAVPEAEGNPDLADEITNHLQNLQGGEFPLGTLSREAIRLTTGDYRYASISPIVGTNWSVLVLSETVAAFDMRYMPLMIAAVVLTVLALLLGGILIQRTVLQPMQSVTEKEQRAIETQQLMYDAVSIPSTLWDEDGNLTDCNEAMTAFFGLSSKEETIERYYEFTPEYQACGNRTEDICHDELAGIFATGQGIRKRWLHKIGEEIVPVEITMSRVPSGDKFVCVCYAVDLRPVEAAMAKERESHEKTRQILDLSPTMINEWSRDLQIIRTNKRAVEWYRVSSQQEYLDCFAELAPECQPCGTPTWQKAQELVTEAFEKGSVDFEWITNTADGELLPIWVRLVRSGDDENAIVYAYTSDLRDIKKLEAQLREKEVNERTQMIMDASPIGIMCYNAERVTFDCNEEAVKLFGFDSKANFVKAFNERFHEFFPDEQPCGTATKDRVSSLFDEVEAHGRAQFEFTQLTGDGEVMPAEVTLVRVNYGDTFMFVSYLRDLRDAKAAEEKERENNEMVKLLLDLSPCFIEIWDEQSNLIECNSQVINFFGLDSAKEFIEKYEQLSPKYQPCGTLSMEKAAAYVQQAFREEHVRFEWMHLTASGEELLVETSFIRHTQKDRNIILGYSHDLRPMQKAMAQQQRLEIAEESNLAKTRFLARMSHEIRTPITSVMGISEIQLQSPDLTPVTEESFAKIYDSSNLLLGIVNDILDLSKIEAGKMELLHEEYQVASLISDAVAPHIVHLEYKDIAFDLHVDENLPVALIGDALRIKQIMNNILSNAFKYTESGSVVFSLECGLADDNQTMLIIKISDTGMGMNPEQLDALFSDYTRFHEQESRNVTGTGLGMSIVYSLTQMMDAEIDVKSEVNKGTVVTVSIPQQVAGAEILGERMAQSLRQFEMSGSFAEKKFKFTPEPMPYGKVLVVDDVNANLYVAKGLLAFYSINTETCVSGFEAIEKIKRGKEYDIIFMDQMMPGLSGTKTMQKMRNMGYTAPIVALTANALIGQAEEFIKNGFDGFISKPIQTVHLNTILQKFIRDKQPQQVIDAARIADSGVSGDIDGYMSSADLADKLRAEFAASHKDTASNIRNALTTGDIETAHRLAHTLKGVAGLIQEHELVRLAGDMENLLRDGQVPPAEQISTLENEVARVLKSIENPESTTPTGELGMSKNSVLIVDDEAMNLTALTHILGSDYAIYVAKNGRNAIDAAKKHKPDLILLDVIMPELSGFDVITTLKQMDETRDIPVIFVTGLNNAEDEEKGLALGAEDYINKPFSPSIVRLRVQNQIKMQNQIRTIHNLSITDTLTGAANRRHFNDRLNKEWKRAVREKTPLSVLMIDVDHFKNYNDTHGHLQGDDVLKSVADAIKRCLERPMDLAARWGGEEFAVVLPNTEIAGAVSVAESIRGEIENNVIMHEDTPTGVTVSIGISTVIPESSSTMERFVSGADKALYRAKESGRNRVCAAEI